MRIQEITEQAFRCVLFLTGCQRPRSIATISKETMVTEQVTRKIIQKLCQNKILIYIKGKENGYILAKSPEKIFPYDIVRIFEKSCKICSCLEKPENCNRRNADKNCPVRFYLEDIQNQITYRLKKISFLELYEQTEEYKQKCIMPLSLGDMKKIVWGRDTCAE